MPSMTADDDHPFDPRATSASAWASSPRPSGSCRAYCAATARTPSPRLARRLPVSPPRTRWMSRMDWTARLAGYMNWMGRCCSAWITPPITIHLGYETRPLPAQEIRDPCLKRAAYPGSITLRLITARTSALSMAGWKAKGCSAGGGPRGGEAGPIERCDPGGHGKIQQNETVFSPSFGVDEECDDARLSLSEE